MDHTMIASLLDKHFSDFKIEKNISGIAYGLIKDGELIHSNGFGETVINSGKCPNQDSVFRIASMTKSFTAMAVLLLRDRGLLRLDDEITQYLPWTESMGIPESGHPITIRDLLTMNAGLPTDDPWGDRQESLAINTFDELVSQGLSFTRAPRMGFEYSNLGYALLGRIVSTVSGVDYLDFVTTQIHQPLGMSATTYQQANVAASQFVQGYAQFAAGLVPEPLTVPGAFSPMGGLLSSVADLSKWVAGFQAAWSPDSSNVASQHPLQRWSRREMQEPHTLARTTASHDKLTDKVKSVTTSYAYGLMIDDDSILGRFVSHSGGYPGFGSHMRWHPQSGWAIVALGNHTYAPMVFAASEALTMIVRDFVAPKIVSESDVWLETAEAMKKVEQLMRVWDEEIADQNFAENMDLDLPRAERVAAIHEITSNDLTLVRVPDSLSSNTLAHAKWLVSGESGLIELELLMSPTRPARIQTLKVAKTAE